MTVELPSAVAEMMKPGSNESDSETPHQGGVRRRVASRRESQSAAVPADLQTRRSSVEKGAGRSLGEILAARRKELGWNQDEAAARTNLTFSYLSRLENDGFKEPSAENLARIAEVYQLEPAKLFAVAGYPALSRLPNCGRLFVERIRLFDDTELDEVEADAMREVLKALMKLRASRGRER